MSSKQTISILLPDLRGGGVERIRLALAEQFAQAGHRVEFILMQAHGELIAEARERFSVIGLGVLRARSLVAPLSRYITTAKPDVLLAAMWPLTVMAPLAARLSRHRCAVLVSEHNQLSVQYQSRGALHNAALRISMAAGYRMADARVAVSAGVADDLAHLSGLSRKKFQVIHNPIANRVRDSSKQTAHSLERWGAAEGKRIITVGSFKAQKNHALLIDAFHAMAGPEDRLMLLGSGPLEGALRDQARDLGLARKVIFAGFQPDPTPFYETADLFVLSSNYEGFGNVIVEALASGTPVVSTDCPSGPAEILKYGEFGTLVPVRDKKALAAAMQKSMKTPFDGDKLRNRAADFSPERAARSYLAALGLSL